jgi:hypothetical protein
MSVKKGVEKIGTVWRIQTDSTLPEGPEVPSIHLSLASLNVVFWNLMRARLTSSSVLVIIHNECQVLGTLGICPDPTPPLFLMFSEACHMAIITAILQEALHGIGRDPPWQGCG